MRDACRRRSYTAVIRRLADGGARGWRLTSALLGDPRFEVNLDATRREPANDNEPPEHGVMLRGAVRR